MSAIKSAEEIRLMREAGLVVWECHREVEARIEPGITTAQLNAVVERCIEKNGCIALFKGVPGDVPFPAASCISPNDHVVHGIPGSYRLKEGDIVSIDIGVKRSGWCADSAATYAVGTISPDAQKLLRVTEETLRLAIESLSTCRMWSEVARRMERHVKENGFSVVRELTGHGIGQEMWEPPEVPNYFRSYLRDFAIRPGLVIAIEPMVNMGKPQIWILPDRWTVAAKDGLPSAHFEHTIAVTNDGPLVLTSGPDGPVWTHSTPGR